MVFGKLQKGVLAAVLILGGVHGASAAMRDPDTGLGPIVNGLNYKYYEGAITKISDIAALKEKRKDTCSSFDISKLQHAASGFAFEFTGYYNVDFDDDFTFTLVSKDGSQLLIGDSVVVNNDGLHATAATKSGTIGLAGGKHKIKVIFFSQGTPSLTVSASASSIGSGPIPDASLFKPYTGVIPTITVTNPKAGQTYRLGDTLDVTWTYVGGVGHTVFLDVSVDNGKTFDLIKDTPYTQDKVDGEYKWVIPMKDSLKTTQAIIAINDYIVGGPEGSSNVFKIAAKGAGVLPQARFVGALSLENRTLSFPMKDVPAGSLSLSLITPKGETMVLKGRASAGSMRWEVPAHLSGSHVAVLSIDGVQSARRVVNFN